MKIQYLFLIVLLSILPMVNADLGTFKQGSCVDMKTVLNTTSVNITSLTYPNTTVAVSNQVMSSLAPNTFNYTFCNNVDVGKYIYSYCDVGNSCYVNSYTINAQGMEYSTIQGLIYVALLMLLIALFGLFTWGYFSIPSENVRNEDGSLVGINYKKYLSWGAGAMAYVCFVGIMFFAWNIAYGILNFDSMASFFQVFYRISFIGLFLVLPIGLVAIVMSYVKDKKLLSDIQRGINPDG